MKIVELQKIHNKCDSLLDWFRLENNLKINRFFLRDFFDFGGQVKNKNKNEMCFKLDYKEVTYNFNVTNFNMSFVINNTEVGIYKFLDEYRYKNIGTRDIYGIINTIVCLLITNESKNNQFHIDLLKILDFGDRTRHYIPCDLNDLSNLIFFHNNLRFMQYTYLENVDFYRVRKNVTASDVLNLDQCLAPPKEFVSAMERLNERGESVLYGCLFFPNACILETNVKKLDRYIVVKGRLKRKLKLAFFINPQLEYFIHNGNDCFLDVLCYIFKMNVVENVFRTSLIDNPNIYVFTNYIKKYANSLEKWQGYIYYSTLTVDNYNVALNRNEYVKIKKVYECDYLNQNDDYNQVLRCNKVAVVSNKKILWNDIKENYLFVKTNFPSFDFMVDAAKYLNVDLRKKEIENGNSIEFDEYGNKSFVNKNTSCD